MGNYREDLKREAKNWISYENCIKQNKEQHYKNQEKKMISNSFAFSLFSSKW